MDSASGTVIRLYVLRPINIGVIQIWSFEELQGQQMFVRRVVVRKEDFTETVKLVYDFSQD